MVPELARVSALVRMSSRVVRGAFGCCCDALVVMLMFGFKFCSVCTVVLVVAVVRSEVLFAFSRCFFSFLSSCILRKRSVFGLCPLTVFLGLVVAMVEVST